jgi:hypothetical protein
LSLDVDYAVLVLKRAFDDQESAACDNASITLENIRGNDDVGDAGFVFEREEDKALGGAGALPGDYTASDADETMVDAA